MNVTTTHEGADPGPGIKGERLVPAYIPWRAFVRVIEKLKRTGMGPSIGRGVLVDVSPGMQSHLRSAMRFLNLIALGDTVTPQLESLVAAYETDTWQPVLKDILGVAYRPILAGRISVADGTRVQLQDAFRAVGVEGQVLEKSIRFLLHALDSAGVIYSAQFKLPERRTRESSLSTDISIPRGCTQHSFTLPLNRRATVIVPDDIAEAEWGLVDGYMRSLIKVISGGDAR